MTRSRQLHTDHFEIDRFDIDHGVNNAPPPRRPSNAQQGPSFLWNGTHQRLIRVLPEDHPNYRENREMITETIRRRDRGTSK
jgi:hypothetical protein